jgi:TniQ
MANHLQNVPLPLQDELALGLLARYARLNALDSISWALKALKAAQPRLEKSSVVRLLARSSGVQEQDFIARHSMLPALFPISSYIGRSSEMARQRHIETIYGLAIPSEQLRWCPKCAASDLSHCGFGHWRREHQIAGVEWCPVHQYPLFQASLESVIHSPSSPSVELLQVVGAATIQNEIGDLALRRLQQIMLGWLNQPVPISLTAWIQVVGKKCQEADLRIGEVGKRPVVSDLIRQAFPLSWLTRHMPEIAAKKSCAFVRKVDGACIDKHVTYSALACAAILTVFFETAEAAFVALATADLQLPVKKSTDKPVDEVLSAFLAGHSLQDACTKVGMSLTDAEDVLRNSLGRMWQPSSAAAVAYGRPI